MNIIDLTKPVPGDFTTYTVNIFLKSKQYHAYVHNFHISSMDGTYIDFPGHIREFDDGFDTSNYPAEKLFMVDASLLRLNRQGRDREIHVNELETCDVKIDTPAVIVDSGWNALEKKNNNEIYFFGKDAIQWFVSKKIHLFVSDVYENHKEPRGIFVEFFKNRILTVCNPANLEMINKSKVKICVFPLKIPGATQVPCCVLAIL
ncbi:MAG: cyclase family protein [Candidatus Omnitrophica bacterium]|nr:cyclase family protein [Candidatus Omnitrophota bacterium]